MIFGSDSLRIYRVSSTEMGQWASSLAGGWLPGPHRNIKWPQKTIICFYPRDY
jgi:hypothetical protein